MLFLLDHYSDLTIPPPRLTVPLWTLCLSTNLFSHIQQTVLQPSPNHINVNAFLIFPVAALDTTPCWKRFRISTSFNFHTLHLLTNTSLFFLTFLPQSRIHTSSLCCVMHDSPRITLTFRTNFLSLLRVKI